MSKSFMFVYPSPFGSAGILRNLETRIGPLDWPLAYHWTWEQGLRLQDHALDLTVLPTPGSAGGAPVELGAPGIASSLIWVSEPSPARAALDFTTPAWNTLSARRYSFSQWLSAHEEPSLNFSSVPAPSVAGPTQANAISTDRNPTEALKQTGGGATFASSDAVAISPTFVPSDPLFSSQWHLKNTGQGGRLAGVDVNITGAWDFYTGAGIKFGVYDDGVDAQNPDLATRYDGSRHITISGVFYDPTVYGSGDAHGTAVAGLIVATQGNSLGVVGGSFDGSVTGVDVFTPNSYMFGAMNEQDRFDVTNHSWGYPTPFVNNP